MAKVTYFGHSAVLVEAKAAGGTKRIIIDPFLDENPLCPKDMLDPGPIDWICLTHGHSDHTGSTIALAKKHTAKVFATWELGMLLTKFGVEESQVEFMNKGGTATLDGISVTLTHALHSSSFDAPDGNTYYAGEACGVALRFADGKTLYHAGDTLLFSDMKLIGEQFKPDLCFLPIGDRFTMGPREAAQAAQLIRPRKVVPIHYATFPMLTGVPEEFVDALGPALQSAVLAPGASMEF